MGRGIWITIILFILIIAGYFVFIYNPKPEGEIPIWNNYEQEEQTCENINGFCVYNNIPEWAEYISPNENIPELYKIDIALFKNNFNNYRLGFEDDWSCKSNNKKPIIINYFSETCGEGLEGCGIERKAVLCDGYDGYFIEEFLSSIGPTYYRLP